MIDARHDCMIWFFEAFKRFASMVTNHMEGLVDAGGPSPLHEDCPLFQESENNHASISHSHSLIGILFIECPSNEHPPDLARACTYLI